MTNYYYVIYIKDYELKEIRRVDTLAYVEACRRELRIFGDKSTKIYVANVLFDEDEGILVYNWETPLFSLYGSGIVSSIYDELDKMIKNYQKFLKK